MTPSLRIALWQCVPLPLDVEGNLRRLEGQASLAKGCGVDLLICPEMFLTGYDIGAPAAQHLAEAPQGPSGRALSELARRHAIGLAYGYPERDAQGRVFNSAQLLDPAGRAVGHCRKRQLFGEIDRAMFTPGTDDGSIGVMNGWRIGLGICYDIEFPEIARSLALAGADVIVVPTANMEAFDNVAQILVPARALENQVFVAYANYCGAEGTLRYGGLSRVAAPDGQAPVCAGRDETLLIAELSRERLEASRRVFTYLHDLRQAR